MSRRKVVLRRLLEEKLEHFVGQLEREFLVLVFAAGDLIFDGFNCWRRGLRIRRTIPLGSIANLEAYD